MDDMVKPTLSHGGLQVVFDDFNFTESILPSSYSHWQKQENAQQYTQAGLEGRQARQMLGAPSTNSSPRGVKMFSKNNNNTIGNLQ